MTSSSAMAAEPPPIDPDLAKLLSSILGWIAGLATATVGATGLWLAQRVLGKAAFQTAINDGFAKLTTDLQEERDRLLREIAAERTVIAAERIAWSEERSQLKGRIRQLEQVVQGLQRRLGITPEDQPDAEPGSTTL